jgi:acyl-coenzyme A thioesterase PaaI-like protein
MPADREVVTVEFTVKLLAPAVGDRSEAMGSVVKSGRTLTVCHLEVFAVRDGDRACVAVGQQTLMAVAVSLPV